MKINDNLSKTLILSPSFLSGFSIPEVKTQDVFDILQKEIPGIKKANETFLINYKEIVMCLLIILQGKNSHDLLIHDETGEFGENYGYLKIRHDNKNNEPDVLLLSDFYKPLYDNYSEAKNFLHKLYSLLKSVSPVYTYSKSNDEETIKTEYPFFISWKAVRKPKENSNLMGNSDKTISKQRKLKYSDLYNVYEEIDLYYNKKLFNILENEHYIFLPDNVSKTIKVLEADNIYCYNSNGKKLSITSNNLTKFLLYVQTHKNQYDFVFSEENGKYIEFANEVLPDLLKSEKGPDGISIPSGIRSKTDFYLYVLMFSYAYNKMIESGLLTPNFDFMFGLPVYDEAAETKVLRLPKIPLSEKQITDEEKESLMMILNNTQSLYSKFCSRLFFLIVNNNDDDNFEMESFIHGYLQNQKYYEAKLSFFEYLHNVEKVDYSQINEIIKRKSFDEWHQYRERINVYASYVISEKKYKECINDMNSEEFSNYISIHSCLLGEYSEEYIQNIQKKERS